MVALNLNLCVKKNYGSIWMWTWAKKAWNILAYKIFILWIDTKVLFFIWPINMNVYRDDFQFITDEEIKIKDLILSVSCISVQCNIVFRSFINQKNIQM